MNLSALLIKHRTQILIWGSFILLYFATRLYKILSLPIFTDEAIYTRWSQIANFDPTWRFISLTDGKQPLFVWINIVIMKFVEDPLLSSRLVSVLAGFFTMVGLFLLGKILFSKKVGFIAALLYIFYPFALVYDRMALYDSLVAAFAVWALFFEVLLVKFKRLDLALILGMILGGGVLTKTSGFISIYLLPLSLLLFDFKEKKWRKKLLKWGALALISVGLAYAYYSILRLSPFLHIVDEKNQIFVYTFSQWLSHPFTFLLSNLRGLLDWAYLYLTLPIIFLVALSFLIDRKEYLKKLLLLSWFIVPFLGLALFGKTLYPRFVLFMTMPLLVLAALSLEKFLIKAKSASLKVVLFLTFASFMLGSDFYILNNFSKAPIPYSDLGQYINAWPAGVGVKEAVEFFREKSKDQKIFVGTEGTFGLMPYALEIYLWQNKNVLIKGYWPISDIIPSDVLAASREMPVYFLFYQPCTSCEFPGKAPISWPLKEELKIKKGEDGYLTIYRVLP